MKTLLFVVALGCFSVMALEINKESVKKDAIAQIGEFQLPENGSKIELELRDGSKIKGTLSKMAADKIYLDVEDGATNVYKPEQLAPGSKWKFFKAEYDKKLKTVIDEITEDKRVEAEVKEKKAAALALKPGEKKETEKKPDAPKVEEKKSVESIKKEFGEFKTPAKDAEFELELTDGTKISGKVSKVSGNKVYLEIEEGRVSVHKRDKILPNSRWKLFKEDFDKKLKDAVDEFKAEEAKKAPPAQPAAPPVSSAPAAVATSAPPAASVPAVPVPSAAAAAASAKPVAALVPSPVVAPVAVAISVPASPSPAVSPKKP